MHRFRSWLTWVGWQRFAFVFVAAPVVAFVAWWLVRLPAPPVESMIPVAPSITAELTGVPPDWLMPLDTVTPARIAVHVVGAVQRPGVYHVPADARADDAVRAAGGATDHADLRRVNLAAGLRDGDQLYVPRVGERNLPAVNPANGESSAVSPGTHASRGGPSSSDATVPRIVDLNQATSADLDSLPGVGPSTAKAIIDHRTRNGPFASVDDLLAVRGIGPAKLAEIRPWVTV